MPALGRRPAAGGDAPRAVPLPRVAGSPPLPWVVGVLLVLPLVAGGLAAAGRPWYPASDWALIELRTRDVGTARTPLLGPFSRFGWNHPGPLMFWLLAPFHRLAGGSPAGLLVGAAALNAAALAAVVAVTHRLGGRTLLVVVAVAAALLTRSLGAEVLVDPWNPWLSLLPFLLFVLLVWGISLGRVLLLPAAAAVGSFLVQTHVGYGALVGALGAWAVAILVADARRPDRRLAPGSLRRALALAAAVVALLWAAPVAEQLTGDHGNLRAMGAHFLRGEGEAAGAGEAASVAGRALHPVAPWLGGPEPQDRFTAALEPTSPLWAAPALIAFAAATVLAWRRRDRAVLRLQGTVAVGLVAGFVATTRVTGDVFFYIVRWWWVLAMLLWVSTAWAVVRAVPARWRHRRVREGPVVAAVAVVLAALALASGAALTQEREETTHNAAVRHLAGPLSAQLDDDAVHLVRPEGFSWFETLFGLVNRLDDDGVEVVVEAGFRPMFGSGRVHDPTGAVDRTLVVATGDAVDELLDDASAELLATFDPLSPRERAELRDRQRDARADLRAAGREDLLPRVADGGLRYLVFEEPTIDAANAARIAELLGRGTLVGVFDVPPPEPSPR